MQHQLLWLLLLLEQLQSGVLWTGSESQVLNVPEGWKQARRMQLPASPGSGVAAWVAAFLGPQGSPEGSCSH